MVKKLFLLIILLLSTEISVAREGPNVEFRAYGRRSNDYLGQAFDVIDDIDKDGYPDIACIVSMNTRGERNGEIIVYSAKKSKPIYNLNGTKSLPFAGARIITYVDVNNDSYREFITVNSYGQITVHSGKNGRVLYSHRPIPSLRSIVSTVLIQKDSDNDGFPELVVGWSAYTERNFLDFSDFNQFWGLVGKFNPVQNKVFWTQKGNDQINLFGDNAQLYPDITGDLVKEILVTGLIERKFQTFRILNGSTGETLKTLFFSREYSFWSQTLKPLSDINGNGFSDFIIGADRTKYSPIPNGRGVTFVLEGSTLQPIRTHEGVNHGNDDGLLSYSGDNLGNRILVLEDYTGDGVCDYALATINIDNIALTPDAPSLTLYDGKHGTPISIFKANGNSNYFFEEMKPYPDWDGDSIPELLIGSPNGQDSGHRADAGELRIVRSKITSPAFRRGDVDQNGTIEVPDGIKILEYLFLGSFDPPCLKALDSNEDYRIRPNDAGIIWTYLFKDSHYLAPPYNDCIPETTINFYLDDSFLDCEESNCTP